MVVRPCGRRAASASQPASMSRRNPSTVLGSGGDLLGATGVVVGLPVSDQRIVMGFQGRVEDRGPSCGKVIRQLVDTSLAVVVIERCGSGRGSGSGARLEFDRGAQLVDRRDRGQLRVMLIGALGGLRGDDPDLIGTAALPHAPGAAGNCSSRPAMVVMVWALAEDAPSFQATNAATDRAPVAPHNSSRSISATMSTMRPSIALRCPANSANSPNNTQDAGPARATWTTRT